MNAGARIEDHPGLWQHPEFHGGIPCVRDTRICVSTVLHTLAMHRGDFDKVIADYKPALTGQHILGCLRYAASLADRQRP